MRLLALGGLVLLAGVAGCATQRDARAGSQVERGDASQVGSPDGANADGGARPSGARGQPTGPKVKLQPYVVQEGAFSDFGMSVKTNFEVMHGGNVQWMEVSGLEDGGSALKNGLAVGDRIHAINGVLVTALERSTMLEALFQRKRGDTIRVLVLSRSSALPRFLVLVAERP